MIDYNYKSSLHFYIISSNKTNKMTNKKYMKIFNIVIKFCLDVDENFILQKNCDVAHEVKVFYNDIVRKCKRDMSLKSYFNSLKSSNLSVIEICINLIKQHLRKHVIDDEESLKRLMIEK